MASSPSDRDSTWEVILDGLHYSYPVILLVVYLVSMMTYSVLSAPPDTSMKVAKGVSGPGGKPLPATKKRGPSAFREALDLDFTPSEKTLFRWLYIGVILTFVANAAVTTMHTFVVQWQVVALRDQARGWWAGKPAAVGLSVSPRFSSTNLYLSIGLHRWLMHSISLGSVHSD